MAKAPFDLPDFIKATGISKMRDAAGEHEEKQKRAAKQRERVRPKVLVDWLFVLFCLVLVNGFDLVGVFPRGK